MPDGPCWPRWVCAGGCDDSHTLRQQYGAAVETRLGLHTGLVIVGAIGDNLRMDYTAVGGTTWACPSPEHRCPRANRYV